MRSELFGENLFSGTRFVVVQASEGRVVPRHSHQRPPARRASPVARPNPSSLRRHIPVAAELGPVLDPGRPPLGEGRLGGSSD
jgi:hypothetical protein